MEENWENRSLMEKIELGYEKAWKTFIQPRKFEYGRESLGPVLFFLEDGSHSKRVDFKVRTKRNMRIECSLFIPSSVECNNMKTCVIYLHSQSGNRIEGLFLREYCASNNYYLLLFDFSGCGLSEGDYVSLGHHEKDDLSQVR